MIDIANILYDLVDKKTVLFLSGGSTPKDLYVKIAKGQKLAPGAVAMVDERYGKRFHQNSNELMIKNTGLLSYLKKKNIRFYPILEGKSRKETAKDYDETVSYLLSHFPKSVAILGIGEDGHTAGLPAGVRSSEFGVRSKQLVIGIGNFPGEFKERITVTFLALSKIDHLIVLVFGEKKRHALELMNEGESIEEVPARFFKRPDIAKKTLLITDQPVSPLARRGGKI